MFNDLRTITAEEVLEWAESKPAEEVVWQDGTDSLTECAVATYIKETTGNTAWVGYNTYNLQQPVTGPIGYLEEALSESVMDMCEEYERTAGVFAGIIRKNMAE
jgi:hypothetical protein